LAAAAKAEGRRLGLEERLSGLDVIVSLALRARQWQLGRMAIASLYRHPIKGFTPQKVAAASLEPDRPFPGDRLYAVEDGPSGFDPLAPAHIAKNRFTVLAKIAEVAKARTYYEVESGLLTATAEGQPAFSGRLDRAAGREAFALWLTALLGEAAGGPLKVLPGEGHRFLDWPAGHVSIINLASIADFANRLGQGIDPLRFRANLYVDGWPAWAEADWVGRTLKLGKARAEVIRTITRCAAPDVDPDTARRDIAVTERLNAFYGHITCGLYVRVTKGGRVAEGDVAEPVA
jgi:hypothetical protein